MITKPENTLLDTCCTSKSFTSLMRCAREGFYLPYDNVLFVQTRVARGFFTQDWLQ